MPVEGDSLNFRIVGFEVPKMTGAKKYVIELAKGVYDKHKLFKKAVLATTEDSVHQLILIVPDWGTEYTWRGKCFDEEGKLLHVTDLHHFKTMTTKYADTSIYKNIVITKTEKYKDLLIIQDFVPAMYNTNGELLWFIPDTKNAIGPGYTYRNLQPTHTGTFTIQNDYLGFEFDYHGKLIWTVPDKGLVSGDTTERYHHDFQKMPNGDYMIEGLKTVYIPVPPDADTTFFLTDNTIVRKDGKMLKKIECPTLIEYDSTGKLVWYWRSDEHLEYEDFFAKRISNGIYHSNPHMNSFFIDYARNQIYLSYKIFNMISVINYPSGKIIANYGPPKKQIRGDMIFKGQHNVGLMSGNRIYMFDNNSQRGVDTVTSYVRIFKEDQAKKTITKVWEFSCDIDTFALSCADAGGSVAILNDEDLLICTGTAGRTFIVSKDKKILWNQVSVRKEAGSGKWVSQVAYRTKYITNINYLKPFLFRNR